MNRLTVIIAVLSIAVCLASGCSRSETSGYTSIDPKGWVYGDTVYFQPSDSDSVCLRRGDIMVVVRHTNAYQYSNIWLRLDYAGPDTIHTDTVNLRLADDFGTWYGKGLGVSFQCVDTVARDVAVDVSQPIKVTHIMRVDTLADIEQVGLIFDEK